jgi:hypothetical protein
MRRLTCLIVLASMIGTTAAEPACTVIFTQNGAEVGQIPHRIELGWQVVPLRKAPFEMSIRPPSCAYLIASFSDQQSFGEAKRLSPQVFASTGTAMAATPAEADILVWPSRSPLRVPMQEVSQDWKVIDTYKAETAALGYTPDVVQAWGSAFPLQIEEDRAVARFTRLTTSTPLDAALPDQALAGVVYLKRKELLKPTWHHKFDTSCT